MSWTPASAPPEECVSVFLADRGGPCGFGHYFNGHFYDDDGELWESIRWWMPPPPLVAPLTNAQIYEMAAALETELNDKPCFRGILALQVASGFDMDQYLGWFGADHLKEDP